MYLTGLVRERSAASHDRHVDTAELQLEFVESTRRMKRAVFDVTLDDGEAMTFETNALGPSIAMPGLGYSGGWNDKLSLGAWRGDAYREVDVWDVSDPVRVVKEDGTVDSPIHRIQPVRVTSAGHAGTGSLTLIANGALPQYGLS